MKGNVSEQDVAFQAPLSVSPPPQSAVPMHIFTQPFEDTSPVGSKSTELAPVIPQFVYGIELTVMIN